MAPNRKILTLKQKIEIVEVHNKEKLSVRNLSKRFNIAKTQASEIIKQKEILKKWVSNSNLNEKRSFLSGEGTKIDKLCYDWFIAARHKEIPLTGMHMIFLDKGFLYNVLDFLFISVLK
nr:unnamed protein product [Callosobruchus analis]CAI5846845.1 unnamed protein product [Callosobruchus analis]